MQPAPIKPTVDQTFRSAPGLRRGLAPAPAALTLPTPSTPRVPGSGCPERRKHRPDRRPAATHPGSAHAAPHTAGSALAAPRVSGPPPVPAGGCTVRGKATATLNAASSLTVGGRPVTSAGSPVPSPPAYHLLSHRESVIARVTVLPGQSSALTPPEGLVKELPMCRAEEESPSNTKAVGGQHLPGGLGRLQPDPRTRRFSVAGPGHPAAAPLSTRSPAHKYPVTLHLRFVTASLRRCSIIPHTLRSFLEALTSFCRRCHQRKAVLGARISTRRRGSASAVGKVSVCGGRQQQVTPVPPTTLRCAPGSCTEKMVRRAQGESGKGMAEQEEDPAFTGKDHQKRGPDGSRGARSTLRPLGVQGGLSAFVPRPRPLRRNLHAKSSVDRSTKKLQTSCVSSCPQRNAITSSYSSTRGFPPGRRRTGPRIPRGLPRRSSRKASEGGPPPPCAARVASQSNSRPDEDAEATRGQKRTWENGAPTSDSPRPGRRRFPLLPRRQGEPLRLPPAPELGFRVTAEDLDAEKAAAFRRINSALRDETPAPQPCRPFPAPADPPAPGRAPRPERDQRESASPPPVDTRASAGGASSAHPWSGGRHGSPGPLSPRSQPLPGPPSHSRAPARFTLPTGAFSPGSGSAGLSPRPPSPSTPASARAPGAAGAMGSLAPAPGVAWLPGFQQKPVWGPLTNAAGGGGPSQPPAWGLAAEDARPAFPAAAGSSGMGSSTTMCLDSPVFTPQSHPPVSDSRSLSPTNQLNPSAHQTRPSHCTSGDLAPHPASDTEVTPMDTIPLSQSPLFGSPPGSSGSLFPSSQALQTPPRDSAAPVTVSTSLPALGFSSSSHTGAPAQPIGGAPDVQQLGAPAWDHSPHYGIPAAPALTGDPTSAPGPPAPPTNSPMGTHAHTQPALAATPAAFPSGPAPVPGSAADTCVPQAVPSAGPNSRPRCSTGTGEECP
ncbi:putative POM121-like protein 1-like [Budorcas taxicolor]|uniref:putative POM121-like protein 1-like n=1 Tax=Budorcas taxicolor TaxID=37181 RepID=UPI0022842871|nr:putative POM121-like protein 1-like [Budorcas taxicolor]